MARGNGTQFGARIKGQFLGEAATFKVMGKGKQARCRSSHGRAAIANAVATGLTVNRVVGVAPRGSLGGLQRSEQPSPERATLAATWASGRDRCSRARQR